MDNISATRILGSLSPEEKACMIARLCHDLTVIARDTYEAAEGVKDPGRLRALNEIQHRMTGFLVAAMEGDHSHCPDDVIAAVFFADREDKYLQRLLSFTFERVYRVCAASAPMQRRRSEV